MLEKPIVFKIIVIGQSGVGKSTMFLRYIKGQFSQKYDVTVGVQFGTKNIMVENRSINLQIWDTSGQQIYRPLMKSFYQGISGIFLTYQIDKQSTLKALEAWHKQAKQNCHQQAIFFLVGTKADLQQNRIVFQQNSQQMMKQLGAVFSIQTSALTNFNIQELFQKAADTMYKKYIVNKEFRLIDDSDKRQKLSKLKLSGSLNSEHLSTVFPQPQSPKRCCQFM